jgi:hypothetical protein
MPTRDRYDDGIPSVVFQAIKTNPPDQAADS